MPENQPQRVLLQPATSVVDIWGLGHDLRRVEAARVEGLPSALVGDILMMGVAETWRRLTERADPGKTPYRPYCIVPGEGGQSLRSLLPEDLMGQGPSP